MPSIEAVTAPFAIIGGLPAAPVMVAAFLRELFTNTTEESPWVDGRFFLALLRIMGLNFF